MGTGPKSTRPPAASDWAKPANRLTTGALSREAGRRRSAVRDRPVLFVLRGPQHGEVFRLYRRITLVGRGEGADVRLTDDTVSREHARLMLEDDGVYLEDLSSRNGTSVAERPLAERVRLNDGDHVWFGANTIVKFSMMSELEEEALRTLQELSLRDSLTRAYNRRYLDDRLQSELSYARRHGVELSLLLLDIDHFKGVNDHFGHPAGDAVLKLVAMTIQRMLRPEDTLARYGGEEFVVIARGTSLRNAQILGERIRKQIRELALEVGHETVKVTTSVGVAAATTRAVYDSAAEMIQAADEALYEAKALGRDRVFVSSPPPPHQPGQSA
jgi:two-component system cell cycle response regulator